MISRILCLLRGHVPAYALHSSATPAVGSYLVTCVRCGHLYEQPVRRLV